MTYPLIHIPSPNPYLGFCKLAGGKPQVICHADDLPSGVVTTWDGRLGGLAGTTVGSPSRADTGWTGGGGITMPALALASTGQWVHYNSEATNYDATTSLLWVVGVSFVPLGTARNFIALGSSSTANNYRGVHINASDSSFFWSNRNGTAETDAGTTVSEGVQALYAIHLKGGTATVLQKTSSGDTTLVNTTHAQSGTLNVNRFTLGALLLNDAQSAATATGYYRFFAALRSPGVDASGLSNLLNYVRYNLRCPL